MTNLTVILDTAPAHEADTSPLASPTVRPIGRVGSPPQLEATSSQFYFWVERNKLVEESQLVRTTSVIDGREIQFFGVIDDVRRRSRKRDIREEFDESDGDTDYRPEFRNEGVTYASVKILRAVPPVLTPPLEQSDVYLGSAAEADVAYGFSQMSRTLTIGRLRNGGSDYAGLGQIDLAYLLGENGGHLNITGMAGVGTKSSLLLVLVNLLLHEARQQLRHDPLHIVPIILNVKGEDLMWIDRPHRRFEREKADFKSDWDALGVSPTPFTGTQFYAPTQPGTDGAPIVDGCNANAYAWALADVLRGDLFPYLFNADDTVTTTMMALVYDIQATFTRANDGQLQFRDDAPARTWQELLNWLRGQAQSKEEERVIRMHHTGTWHALYRRLWEILAEGESIFPRGAQTGRPLNVVRNRTSPPQVIDIHALPAALQRFVVAAIVRQVVAARTGRGATRGLRYLLVLDELNRFAPRNSSDPITLLLERVASEMRSQGVILLGAQQLASQVSTKIIENAAIRVLGRTGSAELHDRVWQSWDKAARQQASVLGPEEKLVMQPTFRQPMYLTVPFPAWAMRREDIAATPLNQTPEV